jgi:aspartyl-tRNA(Asn)/glutamyl-tRNA(Gln) amidotransferase subunit B
MRVEANISVATPENTAAGKFGTKTEVKNLNSFRSVEKAIEYEIKRQSSLLDEDGTVVQETRGWDDKKQETYSQRTKESSHDYRYFPDPDIPKLKISEIPEFKIAELKKDLPELPWTKRDRFKNDYSMTDKEVAVFVDSPALSAYYESIISGFGSDPKRVKLATNYVLTDYGKLVKDASASVDRDSEFDYSASIPSDSFAELITMVSAGEINSRAAKDILGFLFKDASASPKSLAEKHGLIQKSDASDLIPAIEKVIADNAGVVAEYKGGKVASLQFLIGQAMKATKGAGNPEVVKKLLIEKLG